MNFIQNRASLGLHRIFRIIDMNGNIIGISLRFIHWELSPLRNSILQTVLNTLYNNNSNSMDSMSCILKNNSILVIGPPCCGKSSLLRSIAYILSDTIPNIPIYNKEVLVIDTSGDLNVMLASMASCGNARVISVTDSSASNDKILQSQWNIDLINMINNYKPDILLIDDLNTLNQVVAVKDAILKCIAVIAVISSDSISSVILNEIFYPLLGALQLKPALLDIHHSHYGLVRTAPSLFGKAFLLRFVNDMTLHTYCSIFHLYCLYL